MDDVAVALFSFAWLDETSGTTREIWTGWQAGRVGLNE